MKIAYITVLPAYSVGIAKKIKEKADIAKKLGLDIDFYYINPDKHEENNNANFFLLKKSYFKKNNSINKILFKVNAFKNIEKMIFLNKYDYLILRYPLVDSRFLAFIRKYGYKIISEHHTNEVAELFSTSRFVDKIRAYNELLFSKKYLSNVKGIIGVTNEITKLEVEKSGKKDIPNITISNGINTENIKFTQFKKFNGKVLDIIFVASYFYPWHGLDIVLTKLKKYNGNIKINLHLIGDVSDKDNNIINSINKSNVEIILHGKLYGKDLDDLFAISTIAISTIAISTKKMEEACPLKTREYIARGIPFIYGYKDTDLNGSEKFALKIDKDNFDIEQIIDFAKRVSNEKELSLDMRKFAKQKLDLSVKIKKMYNFAKEIANA